MSKILIIIISYCIGGIPFGLIIGNLFGKTDIRKKGSGNIGAANVSRTVSKSLGVLTLVMDVFKGALCVLLAFWLVRGEPFWHGVAGLSAIIGHIFPLYLGFRGGKGYATTIGAFLMLTPIAMLLSGLVFFIVAIPTRIVSIGSIASAVTLPFVILFFHNFRNYKNFFPFAIIAALLIVLRHWSNIKNILAGTEPKFGEKHP